MTFRKLLRQMQPADKLVANAEDEVLVRLVQEEVAPRQVIWYTLSGIIRTYQALQ